MRGGRSLAGLAEHSFSLTTAACYAPLGSSLRSGPSSGLRDHVWAAAAAGPAPIPIQTRTKQSFVTEGENLLTGRNRVTGGRKSGVRRNETQKFLRALRAHSQQCCTGRRPYSVSCAGDKQRSIMRAAPGGNVRSRPKTSKQEIVFLAVAICPGEAGLARVEGISRLFVFLRARCARATKICELRCNVPRTAENLQRGVK